MKGFNEQHRKHEKTGDGIREMESEKESKGNAVSSKTKTMNTFDGLLS